MSFDKKGDNKISVLSIIAVLAISISLVVGAVSINNSLNQTNNTPINETPLLNESLNLTINISEENLSLLSEKEEQISQDISSVNQTEEPKLAMVVNGKSIFDDPYTEIYLEHYNNYSEIDFKNLIQRGNLALLKTGNAETRIEGFILDNRKYAIHLVGCDREKGTCNFRVNGVLANDLSPEGINNFDLNENYSIIIMSIKFDYCDNRRVCDYMLQSYDLVEIEVVEK